MGGPIFEYLDPVRIVSPCVNVCRLDAATGWCVGCGRTGAEIARWTAIDDDARDAVMRTLPARMAKLAD
ncbi:hypothetical protein ASE86_12420 [Sphingomonas sp. Leaf33]|uniref:DUF1289 domain-containing protein n=1 Tax=Sphingomonas sp. Leaf33 TaxID=1736215 RepID=UPI0006F1EB28|nr:DUF1289 domain-containing protein [Sphingomonas sp. Leaf33]KQN19306.1 hypothetical protein ASE86_12420 [Sphingomonas sp. Leaf33]